MTTRRHFLKTNAAIAASLILPKNLVSTESDKFFFIRTDSCTSWPALDPIAWSLEHIREPILERASKGLSKLTVREGERVVRLVLRRCGLNLIEVYPERLVVHYWSQQELADLRPFFKQHGLARPQVEVVLRNRKKETTTTKAGNDFLFGDPVNADFPLNLYVSKWASRFEHEADDWEPAPGTWSGLAWEGVEDNRIPWAALKSAWRRASPTICQNCETAALLIAFGYRWVLNRCPNVLYACLTCRRCFLDESIKDVKDWLVANLDADVLPDFEMVWERLSKKPFALVQRERS